MERHVTELLFEKCSVCGGKLTINIKKWSSWNKTRKPLTCDDCRLMPPQVIDIRLQTRNVITKKVKKKS